MNYISYSFIFFISLLFLVFGSRFSDGGIQSGLFRSLHTVDLLFPFLFFLAYKNLHLIRKLLPGATFNLSIFWILYSFTFAQVGNLMTNRTNILEAIGVGLLFAIKEFEFLLLFSLGLFSSYKFSKLTVKLICLVLGISLPLMIMEIIHPTGVYYIGLPFEKGAIQTGLVYGQLSFFILSLIYLMRNNLTNRMLIFLHLCNLFMITGMLLSLSRTASLSYFAGFSTLIFFSNFFNARRLFILFFIIFFVLLISYYFYWNELSNLLVLSFGRWADSPLHMSHRFDKWFRVLLYMYENPILILFGAGFGSPNELVLGDDLGNILAVDNSYVRRLFETGIFGLSIYCLFIISIIFFIFSKSNLRPVLALISFFLVAGLTAEVFQITQGAGLFYLIIGTIIGLHFRSAEFNLVSLKK